MTGQRVLIIGAGYIASHIARRLATLGHTIVLSSRHESTPAGEQLGWLPVDVRERQSVHSLIRAACPDTVITVHGPSDITWCEANPEQATAAHQRGASYLAEAFENGRIIAISTDNVFPGHAESCGESAPTAPANTYGRAKLAAENILLATHNALALRVSLVYGWDSSGLRPNFFTTCAQQLRAARPVVVPADCWNTPVLADDVAEWTAALLDSAHTGVIHLGGPRRLTRLAWATHIAQTYGVDPDLVSAAPQESTGYACRPRNACLHSERAAGIPELAVLAPMDVLEASTKLILTGEDYL
ncbi:MAG: sugar nucleotide-binding protein [Corynebacteriales bacterium]|nr:sugar nucleotide-binding protein [Mycobacteriales bacterium]